MPCCLFRFKESSEYDLTKHHTGTFGNFNQSQQVNKVVVSNGTTSNERPSATESSDEKIYEEPLTLITPNVINKEDDFKHSSHENEPTKIPEKAEEPKHSDSSTEHVNNEEIDLLSEDEEETTEEVQAGRREGIPGRGIKMSVDEDIPMVKTEKDKKTAQLIKDAFSANTFLNRLIDEDRMKLIVEIMYPQEFKANVYIIKEGEQGSHMYVSAEGTFEVILKGKHGDKFGPGKAFGELAILYNAKRKASIKAKTKAKVWVLDRLAFQKIMMITGMAEQENSVSFLKSVPLLKHLDETTLVKVADLLKKEFFSSGTEIIRQGDTGDKFYIIRAGSVTITKRAEGETKSKHAGKLSRGQYFGELALMEEDCRQATITAEAPGVECLTLDVLSFKKYLGGVDGLKKTVAEYEPIPVKTVDKYSNITLDDLTLKGTLGIGAFGRVELVQHTKDKSITFALKYLKKADIVHQHQEEHVFNEKNILLSCNSPFICKLYKTFHDSKYLYFLLEPCLGGDIWTFQQTSTKRAFDEKTSRFITACVVEAFDHLHSRAFIYRDLKPENLVLDNKGYVKLIDFGFAKKLNEGQKTWTFAGTPEYVAPEIIRNRGHNKAVDYWALGIMVHELLCGKPPFRGQTQMKTYNLILKGIDQVEMPPQITKSAQHLVKKLCRPIPAERLGCFKDGVADIRRHKWFLGFPWQKLQSCELPAPCSRPVKDNCDLSYFDKYAKDDDDPPAEESGWDDDF